MDLRPVDMPRVRDDILEFAHSGIAERMRLLDADTERSTPEPVAADMVKGAQNLAGAELFYIASEMCDLAETAAKTLPEFTLAPEDPPSWSGFMWCAAPIEIEASDEGGPETYQCAGVGWALKDDRLWVTIFIDRDSMPFLWTDVLRRQFPPVMPMGCWPTPVGFDGAPLPVYVPIGRTMLATIKTIWLLMRQPLATDDTATYDRAARRRMAREGKEPPPVRVIALRRPERSVGTSESGREWHHSWIVRGHWRNQPWGPGRELTRPQWIAPYPKGDPDKPLLGGEKVYTVKG